MEKTSLILSIFAILISVGIPVFEYFYNNHINKTNLLSEYFKEIYGEYLIKKIPKARQYIHYNGEVLSGTDPILEVLREVREDSIYFKYNDKQFYDQLMSKVQSLENDIVTKTGNMPNAEYALFYNSFEESLGSVYECISQRHMGKRVKK